MSIVRRIFPSSLTPICTSWCLSYCIAGRISLSFSIETELIPSVASGGLMSLAVMSLLRIKRIIKNTSINIYNWSRIFKSNILKTDINTQGLSYDHLVSITLHKYIRFFYEKSCEYFFRICWKLKQLPHIRDIISR